MTSPSSPSTPLDADPRRRFEAAWRAGTPEPIERFLPADHPSYRTALEELVRVELELAWTAALQAATGAADSPHVPLPRVEDYLRRFPCLNEPGTLARLIGHEQRLRQRHGHRLSPEEYRARFPDLPDSLLPTAPAPGAESFPRELPPAPDLPPGADLPEVPGYAILRELGRGGMGVVYKACDLQLNRVIALKMILPDAPVPAAVLPRLRAEALTVARLRHPGIVAIHHVGEHTGRPFLVLELCEGGSLADRLRRQPQPPVAAAALLERLAAAVQHAHEKGIIHRDLKPANVLLAADGTPKVADFGLARRVEDASATRTQDRVGTPLYMAPEQAAGKHDRVGPCTDVYALGAILYECLTGRPPFLADSVEALYRQICEQEPVPPRAHQPGCPRDLQVICLKCLEKEPARRYATAGALADDLRRFLDGRPIVARPAGTAERAWRWARRNPTRAALAGVSAALVLGVTLGVVLWARVQLQEAERLARLRAECVTHLNNARKAAAEDKLADARHELDLARADEPGLEALRDEATEVLADVEHREALARHLEHLNGLDRDLHRACDESQLELNRELFLGFGRAESLEKARDLAKSAIAPFFSPEGKLVLDPLYSKERQAVIRVRCFELLLVQAEAVRRQGQAEEELHLLDRAGLVSDSPIVHLRRERVLRRRGDAEAAGREKEQARARTAGPLDAVLAGQDALIEDRNAQAALGHFDDAVRLRAEPFWAHFYRALACLRLGQFAEARASLTVCAGQRDDVVWTHLLRAYAQAEIARKLAEDDPRLRTRRPPADRGVLDLWDQRDRFLKSADDDLKEAERLERARPDDGVRYALQVYRSLVELQHDEPEAALAALQEAIRIDPRAVPAYLHLVPAAQAAGQLDLALARLTEAIGRMKDEVALYRYRARVQHLRQNVDGALADLEVVAKLGRADAVAADLAGDDAERALLLYAAKRYPEAVDACDRALAANANLTLPRAYRALALAALGRHDEALKACDGYLQRRKHNPSVLHIRATAGLALYQAARDDATRQRYLDGALHDYDQALEFAEPGRKAVLHEERGWVRLTAGMPGGLARVDFAKALEIDPRNASARTGLGHVLVQRGEYAAGAAEARKAVEEAGPSRSWKLLLNAARVHALAAGKVQADPAAPYRVQQDYLAQAVRALETCLAEVPKKELPRLWQHHLQSHPDWKAIRGTPGYRDLVRRYF